MRSVRCDGREEGVSRGRPAHRLNSNRRSLDDAPTRLQAVPEVAKEVARKERARLREMETQRKRQVEQMRAKIATRAYTSQRKAMVQPQIARHAMLASFRISLGPSQQHRARRVRRESTLTLRVAQQKATASSAASANTRRYLQPRQRQHARVVQRARHRLQAATMKQTAPICVRQAIRGSQERVRPAMQAPTRQPLEAGPA